MIIRGFAKQRRKALRWFYIARRERERERERELELGFLQLADTVRGNGERRGGRGRELAARRYQWKPSRPSQI